jgi:hypothetical protein
MMEVMGPSKRMDNGRKREDCGLRKRRKDDFELWEGKVVGIESEESCGELGVGKETEFEEMCMNLSSMEES